MTFKIDCDDGISALETLSTGFRCTTTVLTEVLCSIDIEQIYEQHGDDIDIPPGEYLYTYIESKLGAHNRLESVCWFHFTRTLRTNNFTAGILPLGQSLELIWGTMLDVTEGTPVHSNLLKLKESRLDDFQYQLQSNDPFYWGPFAFLVKEVGLKAEQLGQHDYLGMPEIIEDICNGYQQTFDEPIVHLLENALVPCVVKFESTKRTDNGCVAAALSYAYTHVRGVVPSQGAVTTFDAKNSVIPKESIVYVQFLEA